MPLETVFQKTYYHENIQNFQKIINQYSKKHPNTYIMYVDSNFNIKDYQNISTAHLLTFNNELQWALFNFSEEDGFINHIQILQIALTMSGIPIDIIVELSSTTILTEFIQQILDPNNIYLEDVLNHAPLINQKLNKSNISDCKIFAQMAELTEKYLQKPNSKIHIEQLI